MYEFGATRYFDSGWHASAGVVFNENSVPNAHYTPLAADMDRYFFSAGAGYKGKHLISTSPISSVMAPRTRSPAARHHPYPRVSTGQTANGNYDFISHAVMVSVGWRF